MTDSLLEQVLQQLKSALINYVRGNAEIEVERRQIIARAIKAAEDKKIASIKKLTTNL